MIPSTPLHLLNYRHSTLVQTRVHLPLQTPFIYCCHIPPYPHKDEYALKGALHHLFWYLEEDIALGVKVTNRFLDLLFVRIYSPLKVYCFYVIKLFLVIFNHHKTTIKAKVLSNG